MSDNSFDRAQRLYPSTVRVLQTIIEAPHSVALLSEKLHLSLTAVQDILNFLYDHKLAYIHSYIRRRGRPSAVWAAGDQPDAQRPAPLTSAEKSATWRTSGGDSHRGRALRQQASKISSHTTLAGQLGLNKKST